MADRLPVAFADKARRRAFMPFSLSNKLLLLTLVFVMVAEVLIYIPSIANFRNVWLQEKLDTAALVAMAASAAPEAALPADLEKRMLALDRRGGDRAEERGPALVDRHRRDAEGRRGAPRSPTG